MPTTFISYNRRDLDFVKKLEQALNGRGVATWREKDALYGQKGWPKTIGEAIAARENFLVVWSKNSTISHIVEFEWNMAMLMQRKIIAVTLDDTPLRENMLARHTINWVNFKISMPEIVQFLEAPTPIIATVALQNILKKLSRFNETKPAQVTRKMRIVYFDSRIENPQVQF